MAYIRLRRDVKKSCCASVKKGLSEKIIKARGPKRVDSPRN